MEMTNKDLRIHTLRGDILSCANGGLAYRAIDRLLRNRYVGGEISGPEFDAILEDAFPDSMKGTHGQVRRGDGRAIAVYVPSKYEDEE